jgi:hypothetical protein
MAVTLNAPPAPFGGDLAVRPIFIRLHPVDD